MGNGKCVGYGSLVGQNRERNVVSGLDGKVRGVISCPVTTNNDVSGPKAKGEALK